MKKNMNPRVLGIPVSCISASDVLSEVDQAIASARNLRILAVNPEKIMRANKDPDLAGMLEDAEVLIPDGIGVVIALRWLQNRRIARLAGADLMLALCAHAEECGYPVFLVGASEDTSRLAQAKLQRDFPHLIIAGRLNGFDDLADEGESRRRIAASGASIVFVALGSPQQERWIARNFRHLGSSVIQGVGGTLDVVAGVVNRAPRIWRACGVEWLYRLLSQPSRIKRQYVLPIFLGKVILARLRPGEEP